MQSALSAVLGAVPALEVVLATLIGGTLIGWSGTAVAASSRDYPGPCAGETVASGVPLFLAADYHGANPVYGVVILNDTGRFRLGISCVATGFVVVRVGPDSALCTVRGRCTPDDLLGLTEDDIDAVRSIPARSRSSTSARSMASGGTTRSGSRPASTSRSRSREARSGAWSTATGRWTRTPSSATGERTSR